MRALAWVTLVVVTSACSTASPDVSSTVSLDITGLWTLKSITVADEPYEIPDEPTMTFDFQVDGRLLGTGFCNDFYGPYNLDGDHLTLGPGFQFTAITCSQPPGAENADEVVFNAIKQEDVRVAMPSADSLQVSFGAVLIDLERG
jgi:heat shock protein HslJ